MFVVLLVHGKVINPVNKEIRRRASHGACALIESEQEGPPMVAFSGGHVPVPAKCSSQLRKLIQEHSINMPPPRILDSTMEQLKQLSHKDGQNDKTDAYAEDNPCGVVKRTNENTPVLSPASSFPPHSNSESRPIYPHLPYSPYGSPATSPRVKRKPLRETNRVNSMSDQSGEFVQLNQYKVEGAIGQVIYHYLQGY